MNADRRPRFARVPQSAIRLTHDDLAIISAVGRHRFLRSTHIFRLLPHRSPQKILERLAELYHAGYLDRPRGQINYYARVGSEPMVYALGNSGAEVFAGIEHRPPPVADWTDKNREAKRPYIEHALLLADLMLPIEIMGSERGDIEVIDARSLLDSLPPSARGAASPWTLTAQLSHAGRQHVVPLVPDAVFALQFKSAGQRSYFYVEADRATMPISRTDLSQSSFHRKTLAYLAMHKAEQHVERLGFTNLRMLTVTTSAERVHSMLDAVRETAHGRGSGMFLFTDAVTFATHPDPLAMPWFTTNGVARIDVPPRKLRPTTVTP